MSADDTTKLMSKLNTALAAQVFSVGVRQSCPNRIRACMHALVSECVKCMHDVQLPNMRTCVPAYKHDIIQGLSSSSGVAVGSSPADSAGSPSTTPQPALSAAGRLENTGIVAVVLATLVSLSLSALNHV